MIVRLPGPHSGHRTPQHAQRRPATCRHHTYLMKRSARMSVRSPLATPRLAQAIRADPAHVAIASANTQPGMICIKWLVATVDRLRQASCRRSRNNRFWHAEVHQQPLSNPAPPLSKALAVRSPGPLMTGDASDTTRRRDRSLLCLRDVHCARRLGADGAPYGPSVHGWSRALTIAVVMPTPRLCRVENAQTQPLGGSLFPVAPVVGIIREPPGRPATDLEVCSVSVQHHSPSRVRARVP